MLKDLCETSKGIKQQIVHDHYLIDLVGFISGCKKIKADASLYNREVFDNLFSTNICDAPINDLFKLSNVNGIQGKEGLNMLDIDKIKSFEGVLSSINNNINTPNYKFLWDGNKEKMLISPVENESMSFDDIINLMDHDICFNIFNNKPDTEFEKKHLRPMSIDPDNSIIQEFQDSVKDIIKEEKDS